MKSSRMNLGRGWRGCLVLVLAVVVAGPCWARIIYVDDDSPGGNGSSWDSAFRFLQDGLAGAEPNDEIRVAQGVYKPDRSSESPEGSRDSNASFSLVADTSVKGGYAGLGSQDVNDWDAKRYLTVLSGDLNGDDVDLVPIGKWWDEPTRIENARTVVTMADHCELNGFVIEGGDANEGCRYTTPFCAGGGVYMLENSNVVIINCELVNNTSRTTGGGIYASPGVIAEIRASRFFNNIAGQGGAIDLSLDCDVVVYDCKFEQNHTNSIGGAIVCNHSYLELTKSHFNANSASGSGGLSVSNGSKAKVSGCLFTGNKVLFKGGAIGIDGSELDINNCTFSGNRASNGRFFRLDFTRPSVVLIENCIVDNGGNETSTTSFEYRIPLPVEIRFTCMPHYDLRDQWFINYDDTNMSVDPCFVVLGHWDTSDTPEDLDDDTWNEGDYHLQSQAGHWDSFSNGWIKDKTTSPCIDAGDPNSPISQEPFPNGGIVNMGAYGGGMHASKSYFGTGDCETIIAGDINGDCTVDFLDLKILLAHWLE